MTSPSIASVSRPSSILAPAEQSIKAQLISRNATQSQVRLAVESFLSDVTRIVIDRVASQLCELPSSAAKRVHEGLQSPMGKRTATVVIKQLIKDFLPGEIDQIIQQVAKIITEEPSAKKPKEYFIRIDTRFKGYQQSFPFPRTSLREHAIVTRRLADSDVSLQMMGGKVVLQVSKFFSPTESSQMRTKMNTWKYATKIHSNPLAKLKGENPVDSLGLAKTLEVLRAPPEAISASHSFFAYLGMVLGARVSTHPMQLCVKNGGCADAVVTNRLEEMPSEKQHLQMHQDYTPASYIPFCHPKLFEEGYFPTKYVNGGRGVPYNLSAVLYVADANFKKEYGMGTVFQDPMTKQLKPVPCEHMKMVLFDGELVHGIQSSNLPLGVKTSRLSFVWKLMLLPTSADASLQERLVTHIQKVNASQKKIGRSADEESNSASAAGIAAPLTLAAGKKKESTLNLTTTLPFPSFPPFQGSPKATGVGKKKESTLNLTTTLPFPSFPPFQGSPKATGVGKKKESTLNLTTTLPFPSFPPFPESPKATGAGKKKESTLNLTTTLPSPSLPPFLA